MVSEGTHVLGMRAKLAASLAVAVVALACSGSSTSTNGGSADVGADGGVCPVALLPSGASESAPFASDACGVPCGQACQTTNQRGHGGGYWGCKPFVPDAGTVDGGAAEAGATDGGGLVVCVVTELGG
jgi:hypothetical protein